MVVFPLSFVSFKGITSSTVPGSRCHHFNKKKLVLQLLDDDKPLV